MVNNAQILNCYLFLIQFILYFYFKGTCKFNPSTSLGFDCTCQNLYYGEHCEYKTNICANETCSTHGYCLDVGRRALCKCFYGYEGELCEIKSDKLKKIETQTDIIGIGCWIYVAVFIALLAAYQLHLTIIFFNDFF